MKIVKNPGGAIMRMRFFKQRPNYWSLLITLLAGFLTVVLLLVSFNFLSFAFFQTKIRQEIINYNSQNLNFTSDRYEEHFRLIAEEMYALYYNEHVILLHQANAKMRYAHLEAVRQQIGTIVANPLLYVDDILFVFKDLDIVLGKNGTFEQKAFFEEFYASRDYPLSFWKMQFAHQMPSAVYASSDFYEHPFHLFGTSIHKGEFFPYILKNQQVDQFYIVVMLDAKKLYRAFHRSLDAHFLILDPQGKELFRSFPAGETIALPPMERIASYVLLDDKYYFYHMKPSLQPRTYVNMVESKHISDHVASLNQTLLGLLIAAIAVSISVSVLFSVRFYRPVKQIIEGTRVTTRIKEFEIIKQKMNELLEKNTRIERNLLQKSKLLLPYSYFSALKKIYQGSNQIQKIITMEFPFQLILFEIHFKPLFIKDSNKDADRIVSSVRELIQSYFTSVRPNTVTFQVEDRQILSIIGDPQSEKTDQWLAALIDHFEYDKPYYCFTIAVSPQYPAGTDFRVSFEETANLLKERKLNEDNQIIRKAEERGVSHLFTPEQDHQFVSHLQAGNAEQARNMLDRQFKWLARKHASLRQYEEFTNDCIQKIRKMLHRMHGDEQRMETMASAVQSMERFFHPAHYEAVLHRLVSEVCEAIRTQKHANDPIIEFTLEYVQMNYHQDLTLDTVAKPLNITGGYLSTYFKEKTGKNFIDYVHEVRIREAKRMLLETDWKIQDIAGRCGYPYLNSFNRIFKKMTGMSPREYRKFHARAENEQGA